MSASGATANFLFSYSIYIYNVHVSLSVGATSLYILHSRQIKLELVNIDIRPVEETLPHVLEILLHHVSIHSKKSDNLDDLAKFIFDSGKAFSNFTKGIKYCLYVSIVIVFMYCLDDVAVRTKAAEALFSIFPVSNKPMLYSNDGSIRELSSVSKAIHGALHM